MPHPAKWGANGRGSRSPFNTLRREGFPIVSEASLALPALTSHVGGRPSVRNTVGGPPHGRNRVRDGGRQGRVPQCVRSPECSRISNCSRAEPGERRVRLARGRGLPDRDTFKELVDPNCDGRAGEANKRGRKRRARHNGAIRKERSRLVMHSALHPSPTGPIRAAAPREGPPQVSCA